ncbi:MAG: GTP cyclohydrolase I FolE [Planctomycetota bacterium]|nr:GTP cyclohydrolase I FolE [Planctomycetota bacterium]
MTEHEPDHAAIAERVREILALLGDDPARQGLLDTPKRVAKSLDFLTSGYRKDPIKILEGALFDEQSDEMVVVRDVELYSTCEHHILPFTGKAHVAYLPDRKIVGLSKIPRVVDVFARRLQVQERLTVQIANAVAEALKPKGVAVVIEARHMCMMMRGVEKQNSFATTSCMLGMFKSDPKTRAEFLNLIGRRPEL